MSEPRTFEPRPYKRAVWARGPHLQTLFARALRAPVGPAYERERVETPDGDFLDLDWGPELDGRSPIALILHGLEGSSGRRYVRNVSHELIKRGVRPVALNFRGCSGEPNRLPRYYHSGETTDPAFVLRLLRERYPNRPLCAFGFSLGGNVLLKLMGEDAEGGRGLLDAAVAMSVPYDLAAGAALLERSFMGRRYATYFLRMLHHKVTLKAEMLAPVIDLERVLATDTIWSFDEYATAPLSGFDSAAHYYQTCSSTHFLGGIRVPTLLLHSVDDPFLPFEAIPRAQVESNAALRLELHSSAGHVGFLEGSPWSPRFWGDEEGARFLAETSS